MIIFITLTTIKFSIINTCLTSKIINQYNKTKFNGMEDIKNLLHHRKIYLNKRIHG